MELRHLLNLTNRKTGQPFQLFDFPYPFDDLAFKAELEKAVTDYYFYEEIGQENPTRFKHVFQTRWLRMIGYYNELHNTTLLDYDPLINNKSKEVATRGNKGKATATSSTTGKNIMDNKTTDNGTSDQTESDYPQAPLIAGSTAFNSGTQKTITATDGTSKTTQDTTNGGTTAATNENNEAYERTIEAVTGTSYAALIKEHRSALLNLKEDIIKEMKPCFILVY